MNYGIHLALFKKCFVNNVHIDNDEAMAPKEKRPPPIVLKHPVFNSSHITKLITEVN